MGVNGSNPQTHCKRGHELTSDNIVTRNRRGRIERQCKKCAKEAQKRYERTDKGKRSHRLYEIRREQTKQHIETFRDLIRFPLPLYEEVASELSQDIAEWVGLQEIIQEALARMSEEERTVVCTYADTFSLEETASGVGYSIDRTEQILNRAREKVSDLCEILS